MNDDQSEHVAGDTRTEKGAVDDVTITGQSTHETQEAHDAGGHGATGGHGEDISDVPTIVPTTWRQLIFPALILVLVLILVAGPVTNALAPRPAAPAPTTGGQGEARPTGVGGLIGAATETPQSAATVADTPALATATTQPTATPPGTPTTSSLDLSSIATRTAVAEAGENGVVARIPTELEMGGARFTVNTGNNLLPDWKPSQDPGTATWIQGTFANHVLYVPYNDQNKALFDAVKPGDAVKVTMNTGQVFSFTVTRTDRALNGPPTTRGQFTVTTAMAQDHAGVTLFLIGDPAADRAVVQADFNGSIQ